MFDNIALELFILGVILGALIFILIKCFGAIKLLYLNFKWLHKFKQSMQGADDLKKKRGPDNRHKLLPESKFKVDTR